MSTSSSFAPLNVELSWPLPNYVNPITKETHGYFILCSIFLTLATSAVTARLYARVIVRRWLGLDDIFVVLAYISTIGVFTTVIIGTTKYDWDKHIWDTTPAHVKPSVQYLYFSSIFWAFSSIFTRLSLLCFYYRLLDHISIKRFRWVLHAVVVAHVSFLIALVFSLTFSCVPINAHWDDSIINAKCILIGRFYLAIAITNTCMEFFVAILPIPVIFDLRMEKRQRWSVISLLSLGFLVTIVGCVRCYFVWKGMLETYDITWWSEQHWICSEVENDVALVCACAPALRPVIGRLLGRGSDTRPHRMDMNKSTSVLGRPSFAANHTREKATTFPSMNSTLIWFDLEGIADDGLGYSVSITAGHGGQPAKGKLRKIRRPHGAERLSMITSIRQSFSRAGKGERRGAPRVADDEKPIEIVARRSVEVHESFRAETSAEELQNWGNMSDKDTDMDIERTAADLKDWSLLGSPASALTRPGSTVRSSEDRSARDSHEMRKPSGSVTGQSPLPRRKNSSPQRSWQQSLSPRFKQPVTKPLNSSQWWASPQSRSAAPSINVSEDSAWLNEILGSSGENRGTYREESMLAVDGSQEALSSSSANV